MANGANYVQGITSNDIDLLQKGRNDVVYTAFLNAQGRFLHDAFLYATGAPLIPDHHPMKTHILIWAMDLKAPLCLFHKLGERN